MRKLILSLAVLAFACGAAYADEANLDGGVFAIHYAPDMVYSTDPPADGWCGEYIANHAIGHCSEIIAEIYVDGYHDCFLFVLSAWASGDKEAAAAQFGLGDYHPYALAFVEHGECFVGDGLTIPSSGWPGPNEGIALAPFDPWVGNYFPVYFLYGFAYSYYGPQVVPLGPDTTVPEPFGGWVGPTGDEFAAVDYGALGINTEGYPVCPYVVCCDVPEPGDCMLVTDYMMCEGTYLGDSYITCDPNPCEYVPPTGACCVEPCPECIDGLTEEECLVDMQGFAWFQDTMCDDQLCLPFTPSETESWGSIKKMYR
jgi:hypothetical protein